MERAGKQRLALATSVIAVLLALAIGEAVARSVNREGFSVLYDREEEHPYRPFLHREVQWGQRRYTLYTSSLGWKDRRAGHRVEKDPGDRLRVVFLGDSFTEGVGYPQEETLSGRAERILNARGGRRFEVLNGGRSSYCPLLEYQRLRRFLADGYKADLVVALPDVSDVYDELAYGGLYERGTSREPLPLPEPFYRPVLRTAYNHSSLLRAVRIALGRAAHGEAGPANGTPEATTLPATGTISADAVLGLGPDQQRILRANWMFHEPSLRGWTRDGMGSLLANLGWIHRLTREASIPLIVVTYPWPTLLYDRDDPALYRRLVRRWPEVYGERELVYGRRPSPRAFEYERLLQGFCRARAIPQVDLFADFRRDPRWYELFLAGDVHFNEKGNELAAERISQAVVAVLAGNGS